MLIYYTIVCVILLLTDSYKETLPVQGIVSSKNQKTRNKCQSLIKVWFTPQLKEIKNNITFLNQQTKTEKNLSDLKFLKLNFRKVQRRNIYLSNCKEHDQLESIANLKDKGKFWKFLKKACYF